MLTTRPATSQQVGDEGGASSGSRPVLVDASRDQAVRWEPGERLHHVFDDRLAALPDAPAFELGGSGEPGGVRVLTTAEVSRRADQTARLLRAAGVGPGARVALVLDEADRACTAMVAVSRLHAAYVPLDAAFPPDRVAYVCADADVRVLLTTARLRGREVPVGVVVVEVEDADALPDGPLSPDEAGEPVDELAYVVYTSGTTGRPKGVAVEHASIVSFVRVAAGCYGYRPDDRVYQGMTIAFDFSVEESWVPWAAGAVLVPKPAGASLVGAELQDFLVSRRITGMACVPTLLTTLDAEELPLLRLLLVSGEACPQDVVTRWCRPGRRMLNVYGPTEATVTATWQEVHPDRPVTLGLPLPTYTAVLLALPGDDGDDVDDEVGGEGVQLAAPGEQGEIGLAGVGLAVGYLGRDDLTARAFVPDPFGLPNNPSGRIYRTGDLGSLTADGQLAYHGRIDTQVKVRGYRIELAEVESVLLGAPGVAQAVVSTWEPVAGSAELVAYYAVRSGPAGAAVTSAALRERLREELPPWMVPAFYERLDRIPMTTSDKADRKALPAPSGRREGEDAEPPATPAEEALRDALAAASGLPADAVGVTADLFADLGTTSLVVSRFCTRLREGGREVPVREVYRLATLRALAGWLDTAAAPGGGAPALAVDPVRTSPRPSSARVTAFGAAQVALAVAYAAGLGWALHLGYDVLSAAQGLVETALRALAVSALAAVVLGGAPVAAKWLLVGRWRECEVPLWSAAHLRLWAVRSLVRSNPLVLFAGTPVYNSYLRALGVRVGRGALVLTNHVPVASDLVEIGPDAVVSKGVWMLGYRVESGRVTTGRITIGARAYVGEASVLDTGTRVGDDAQLAHASSLQRGQEVPDGERWHGSPAEPAGPGADYQRLTSTPAPTWRRAVFGTLSVAQLVVVLVPLLVGVLEAWVGARVVPAATSAGLLLVEAAVLATVLVVGLLLVSLLAVGLLARLAERLVAPGVVHPVPGVRYLLHRLVARTSNNPFLVTLTGDSAVATRYMRWVGWRQPDLVQTGSNFGTTHAHEAPSLCRVGSGTMISDGLSMANADYASNGFRLARAEIGARSFLGNRIVYPAGGRTGDDVLLATKVLVPLDGPVRTGTGLLGSPAFEIPRTSDRGVAPVPAEELPERMRSKLRSNLASMALLLGVRWTQVFVLCLLGVTAVALEPRHGALAVVVGLGLVLPASTAVLVLAERLSVPGWRLRPRACSIYDPYFWRHERMWKLLAPALVVFDGTTLKPLLLRALGVRVGRRLYDDGATIPEHTLVELGDDVCLGAGSTIQCHSLEDGVFTSARVRIGDGATVGTGAFVHHGVVVGAGAVVDPDAFCLKGSELAAGSRWRGNPAAPAA